MLIYTIQARSEDLLGVRMMGYIRRGYEVLEIVVNPLDEKQPYKAFLMNKALMRDLEDQNPRKHGKNESDDEMELYIENTHMYDFKEKIKPIYRNFIEQKLGTKCCFVSDKFIERVYVDKSVDMKPIEAMFKE